MKGTLWSKSKIAAAALFALCFCSSTMPAPTRAATGDVHEKGAHENVVFENYSPLAASEEQQRRLLTPLLAKALQEHVAASGQALSERSMDLSREHFSYYVPHCEEPASGYRVLVFVPPWQRATLPHAWFAVLDRHATILVTAAASGNEENVIGRRIPLALAGYENIAGRFPVDASRVWIGGLSGGSRVAQRIALAYPDLFHGALLNAGSDRFGTPELPFPPAPLLQRVEEGTRLVYATGTRDESNLAADRASRDSAQRFCIADLRELPMRNAGHALLDAGTLDRALSALEAERSPPGSLDICRTERTRVVDEAITRVETSLARGDHQTAQVELTSLDARFGALALPQSLQLAQRIAQATHAAAAASAVSR